MKKNHFKLSAPRALVLCAYIPSHFYHKTVRCAPLPKQNRAAPLFEGSRHSTGFIATKKIFYITVAESLYISQRVTHSPFTEEVLTRPPDTVAKFLVADWRI
jgi:hypothetical protein